MLNKIIIGTANFTQPYGVLSQGDALSSEVIEMILRNARTLGIEMLDSAFDYGDIAGKVPFGLLKEFRIVTKISVLDSEELVLQKFQGLKGLTIDAVLIHDPQNLEKIDKSRFCKIIDRIRQENSVKKVGVSVYTMADLENFRKFYEPDVIQIPLNPLNQHFNNDSFLKYIQEKKVEVHARSLFLQGILLSDTIPLKLRGLESLWTVVRNQLSVYDSPLHGLLGWAFSQSWVDRWVIGFASADELTNLAQVATAKHLMSAPVFGVVNHELADPRNWK